LIAGDYEEATDHIDWSRAKPICFQYLDTIGLGSWYNKLCLEILFSRRRFVKRFSAKGALIEDEWISHRGSLMGEPGTKIVLSILTRVAHQRAREATGESTPSIYFASAGDDQLDIGTYEYYLALKVAALDCGLKPSEDKFGFFQKATNYCEQIVTMGTFP
jgi:hypothetical protein